MLLAGADVTMLCSVLLRHGTEDIRVLERELREWLEKTGTSRSQNSKDW
jgi:dihydroorotate dehydrogenase (fumarate)